MLFGIGVCAFALIATPVAAFMITFAGDAPIEDGATLGSRAKQIKDGMVSIGVIDVSGDELALVDCGNDQEAKALEAELHRRNANDDSVKAIFITHGHRDHVAACTRFSKAEVYAMAGEKDIIEGRAATNGPLPRWFGAFDSGTRVLHTLSDGDKVTIGEVTVEAFALPGHTRGSAAYLADGVLYFGDGASGSKNGELTPAKYLFSDDQKEDIASLKALEQKLESRADEIKTLEFAHSGPLAGFDPLRVFAASH
jgi:hydroxyacylglutathione hydrolase